jgi:hypothetical protein
MPKLSLCPRRIAAVALAVLSLASLPAAAFAQETRVSVCGEIAEYTPPTPPKSAGSLTIDGDAFTLAPHSDIELPLTAGSEPCLAFAFDGDGRISSVTGARGAASDTTLASAAAPNERGGSPGTVAVVNHLCPASVRSQADFDAIGAFAELLLTCPVATLPGDTAAGASAGRASFDFRLRDGDHRMRAVTAARFVPATLCEPELGEDVNGDGASEPGVCLNMSHYSFTGVARGAITLRQSEAPRGYSFGAVAFTPKSDDAASLVSVREGVVRLDTSEDGDVALHVFNFPVGETGKVNAASAPLRPSDAGGSPVNAEGLPMTGGAAPTGPLYSVISLAAAALAALGAFALRRST